MNIQSKLIITVIANGNECILKNNAYLKTY